MSKYSVGIRSVGSYLGHCTPFVHNGTIRSFNNTSNTEHEINFPYVTRRIIVKNHQTNPAKYINVAFHSTASVPSTPNRHTIPVAPGSQVTLDVKTDKVFLTAARPNGVSAPGFSIKYSILAELTNIPTASMYALDGPGLTE